MSSPTPEAVKKDEEMTVSGLSVSHYIVVEIFSISDTALTLHRPCAALITAVLGNLTNVPVMLGAKVTRACGEKDNPHPVSPKTSYYR